MAWKQSSIALHDVLERRAGRWRRARAGSRVVDSAVRPRVAAQQPPAGHRRRPAASPCLRSASTAYCEQVGWYLQVLAGRSGEIERLVEAGSGAIATRADARRSCRGLPEHLVDPLAEPRRGRAPRPPRAGPGGRPGRSRSSAGTALEPARADLAQLSLDPVADDRVPDGLAAPRSRAAARRPARRAGTSRGQEAGRDRPALAVDGVEVPGAGEAVPALHRRHLGREALAALRAAALEDHAAGTRRHAGAEAVLPLAPAHVWLIGPFHRV